MTKNKYPGLSIKAKTSACAAIRLKCLDCMGRMPKEVARCHIDSCSLWPFRFGQRPSTADRLGKHVNGS